MENFTADLAAVLDRPIRIVRPTADLIWDLRIALADPADDPVLIAGLDQAEANDWQALDINRSAFARPGPLIFWLSPSGLTALCQRAPNLRSFIGGSIFNLAPDGSAMTPAERQERISELETHFRMTSEEVVPQAQTGMLPAEPHFVEWLVLLGRGDLV